ncbi:MAG: hypothetical protein NT167_28435 [Verrucomicrobia bacterium]|nr:hypothetical protein [Verrucomicrobiota bacterium]
MSNITHRSTADDLAGKLITMLLHDLIVDSAARVRRGDLSGARHDLTRAIETLDSLESSHPITPLLP